MYSNEQLMRLNFEIILFCF